MQMRDDWNRMLDCGLQGFYQREMGKFDRLARDVYKHYCDLANQAAQRVVPYRVVPPTLEECQENYREQLGTFGIFERRPYNVFLSTENDDECSKSFARFAMGNAWDTIVSQNPCV